MSRPQQVDLLRSHRVLRPNGVTFMVFGLESSSVKGEPQEHWMWDSQPRGHGVLNREYIWIPTTTPGSMSGCITDTVVHITPVISFTAS